MFNRLFNRRPFHALALGLLVALGPDCRRGVIPPVPVSPWGFTYGGAGGAEQSAYSPPQNRLGGYFVTGTTYSFGAGMGDGWIVAIRPDGGSDWARSFGGFEVDHFWGSAMASNGDIVVAGDTLSFGAGGSDLWVMRVRPDGSIAWQKTFGGANHDGGSFVWPTSDDGFVVGGIAHSFAAAPEPWILKLDSSGTPVWQNRYGLGELWSLTKTPDGGFIATVNPGNEDLRLFKIDGDGNPLWESYFALTGFEYAHAAIETSDGGCLVVGKWAASPPNYDLWVMKLKSDGSIDWQFSLGGANWDEATSAIELAGGGFLVAGSSLSTGDWEGVLLRLNADGSIAEQNRYGGAGYDTFESLRLSPDGGYLVQGTTSSFGSGVITGFNDLWVLNFDAARTLPIGGKPTSFVPSVRSAVRSIQTSTVTATTVAGTSTAVTGVDSALEVHSVP